MTTDPLTEVMEQAGDWTDIRAFSPRKILALIAERDELRAKLAAAEKSLRGYESWARSVNEALNSGDGSYRP